MTISAFRPRLLAVLIFGLLGLAGARANPTLVVDVDTDEVLYEDMSTAPWFPASLTKLMTTYVALSKVREGKVSMDTPLRVSARAASMAPSKMGFRPGTLVTLDNALKMLMVKSPNDIAVTIAEGISGSVEAFADEMNAYGSRLGLHESHFVNPNGLPDERHVSSARDMALIGRALLREFPDQHSLFGIGALSFGGRIINNHNGLLGRYPGVDGMKTGYTCSAGYNVVASAQRGDKRLIVVILGAPSVLERSVKAAGLFERFFGAAGNGSGRLETLPASDIVLPPDMRGQICGPGRRNAIAEAEAEDATITLAPAAPMFARAPERGQVIGLAGAPAAAGPGPVSLLGPRPAFDPVRVYIGPAPGWTGPVPGATEIAAPGPKGNGGLRAPPAVALAPSDGVALAEPGIPAPLALAGATASPALAATNRAVRTRGRLSLRVASRPHGRDAETKPVKTATAPAGPVASETGKDKKKARPRSKTAATSTAKKPQAQ